MKVFTNNLKSWFILTLSVLLVGIFIFSCTSTPRDGETSTTTTTTTGRGDGDDDDDDDDDLASCSLPKCSGSDCCNKGSKKQREECEEWCGDLNLDSDGEELCLTLDRDFVEDPLLYLFDNKEALKEPDDNELVKNIKDEDIDVICGAVRELGSRIWSRLIDKYGNSESEAVLGWVAQEKKTVKIFKSAEDDEGIKMFKQLLSEVGTTGSGDALIVSGLDEEFDFNDDENDYNILERAVDRNNDQLLKYIHTEVLEDKKEGICGERNTNNWPTPECHSSASDVDSYSNSADDGCSNARTNSNRQRACILGVYCKVANEGSGNTDADSKDNRLRADLADELADSGMKSFIKKEVDKGGLTKDNNINDNAADEWKYVVCERLKCLWKNGSGLDLGLGTTDDDDGCA